MHAPPIVFRTLADHLCNRSQDRLLEILRLALELPLSELTISIVGWFCVNSLIPRPTQFVFLQILVNGLPADTFVTFCAIFGYAILPRLHLFPEFCQAVVSVPDFEFRFPELYVAMQQCCQAKILIDPSDFRVHYVVPRSPRRIPEPKVLPFPKFVFGPEPPEYELRATLGESLEVAKRLQPEDRGRFYVQILLNFPEQPSASDTRPLLKPACGYALALLDDFEPPSWDGCRFHPQLKRLGLWIGALTLRRGRPPPLSVICIPNLLQRAIVAGSFSLAIVFVTALFTGAASIFRPPNPLTVRVLEILAAVRQIPRIRLDVIEAIDDFGRLMELDVASFFRRSIEVPDTSFDRQARFVPTANDCFIFQSPTYCHGVPEVNDRIATRYYFRYTPDLSRLSPLLRDLSLRARTVERHYFVGVPSQLQPLRHYFCLDESISTIVSLALSDSAIVSSICSRLFRKIAHGQTSIDLDQIFRCAFPTRDILAASLETNSLLPSDLNALFCDLLTNPHTRDEALPRIKALLPLCLASPGVSRYLAVLNLCKLPSPPEVPTDLPPPDTRFVPLLRSFRAFFQSADDRTQFLEHLRTPRAEGIQSLLHFVFHVTKTTRSLQGATKIDYSAIDCLCFALSKAADKGALEVTLINAIQMIAKDVVATYPLSLFRLLHGLLSTSIFQEPCALIDFIESLKPSTYPTFACCWIQLCLHRTLFPRLVRTNRPKPAAFCVRYVLVCIELCKIAPHVFYRAVTRILMTIAATVPIFFVSYHAVFLADLPMDFMQFRNIILTAAQPATDAPPPKGYPINAAAFSTIYQDWDGSHERLLQTLSTRASIWQFVIFSLEQANPTILDIFLQIARSFPLEIVESIVTALFDQIRYDNLHTRESIRVIIAIFDQIPTRRALILFESFRRMLCVTPPPLAVSQLQKTLKNRFGAAVSDSLRQAHALEIYARAKAISGVLGSRSPPAWSIHT
jgi:hypothetical protein